MTVPVEIKELVIRAVVGDKAPSPAPAKGAMPASVDQDAIVEAAVREVLRILSANKER
jgi:hypothetical protein